MVLQRSMFEGGAMDTASQSPPYDELHDGSKSRLVFIGSSVCEGYMASSGNSWVDIVKRKIKKATNDEEVEVINLGEAGDDSKTLIVRLHDSLTTIQPPIGHGDAVVVALSLTNEGLATAESEIMMNRIVGVYLTNLKHIAMAIERTGALAVVAGVYPYGGDSNFPNFQYSPEQYEMLQLTNDTLVGWGRAGAANMSAAPTSFSFTINFLPSVENGMGHWKQGFAADPGHPNDRGHAAMGSAFDVGSLLRMMRTKPLPDPNLERILAFGDSLTAGYHTKGYAFAPWAPFLSKFLNVRVDVNAGSGVTANAFYQKSMEKSVQDKMGCFWSGLSILTSNKIVRYSRAVIMIGTNDIHKGLSAHTAFTAIRKLHKICHENDVPTVAISIPSSKFSDKQEELASLNEMLEKWAASKPEVDWMPFPFDWEENSELWEDDGVHMSEEGYEVFAHELACTLSQI